jgi:subtilisin family serine protease
MSGTSMAGPHVAGVVALMWSANPKIIGDIERTRQILYASSDGAYNGVLPGCAGAADIPSTAVGYGMIDAYNAVKAAIELK